MFGRLDLQIRTISTYLTAEAVANSADLLNAESLTGILNSRLNDGLNVGGLVVGKPCTQISLARLHVAETDLVALEKIRDDSQVTIVGELVGEELGVDVDAEDIGQEDNGLLGGLVILRVGDVGVDWRMA